MIIKNNYKISTLIIISTVIFLSGCGQTNNMSKTQKTQETSDAITDMQAVDDTNTSDMSKICADYCMQVAKDPAVSKVVCMSFCDDVIKQCEKSDYSDVASAKSCIQFGMLKPLSEKYPSIKARINASNANAQSN